MRWTPLLLPLMAALAIGVAGSPVVVAPDHDHEHALPRQAAPAAPVAVAAAAEEDDDDDDDDVDLDLEDDDEDEDDDDDDTADDDDDDDDEDYFERFFDDILGDSDDDDEDDDDATSVVAPLPVAAAPVPAASAPVPAVAAVQPATAVRPGSALPADIDPADYDEPADGEQPSYDDEPAAEEQAADAPVTIDLTPEPEQGLKDKPQPAAAATTPAAPLAAAAPAVADTAAVAAAAAPADDDDDEDDDDDDDFDVDLTDDDEDDDDEDDDDDDEDDDEDELEEVVGDSDLDARESRSMSSGKPGAAPPIYISKYNRFVDSVLSRINRVLKKSYDPVNVRLHPPAGGDKKKAGGGGGKKKAGGSKKKAGGGNKPREGEAPPMTTAVGGSSGGGGSAAARRNETDALAAAVAAVSEQLAGAHRPSQRLVAVHTVHKAGRAASKRKPGRNRPGARATLYGLSSLKRDGDVTVNMMSSHNTIKTKFTIGPLMLKVEKEFGRGAKKDIRSATATTTEMSGRLNLRVMHGGAATLHSIRVMQPRQVRVESLDDHDKTREYIWRRSSNIARVVTQKLTNATRSMLQPPPVPTTFMSAIFS